MGREGRSQMLDVIVDLDVTACGPPSNTPYPEPNIQYKADVSRLVLTGSVPREGGRRLVNMRPSIRSKS